MDRAEALERLRQTPETVVPDAAYVVEPFRDEDAEGVAVLYFRVYGDAYPIETYYIPEAIRQVVARGELHAVVARLAGGEIVGFAALYASSPPFPGLMEFGQGMVHPAYRGSLILFHLYNAAADRMRELDAVEAVFGEAVCDTIITQHASALFGFREVALELDLMPGHGDGRIACLVMFRNLRDRSRRIHAPAWCAEELRALAQNAGLDREFAAGDTPAPESRLATQVFAFASVARLNLHCAGRDFAERFAAAEAEALGQGCRILQAYLNLGDAGAAAAASLLRERGYRLGGLAPRWFDDDALLLQKLLDPPNVAGIHLYSDRAKAILELALRD